MQEVRFVPKRCSLPQKPPLPILDFDISGDAKYTLATSPRLYKGIFNGFNVTIQSPDDMITLYTKGYFGKGSLSQGYPSYENRLQKNAQVEKTVNKSGLYSDSIPTESDVQLKDANSESEQLSETISEELHLSLEEAFFLSYGLNCLNIYRDGELLDHHTLWSTFQKVQSKFIERYVAYHYYRAKNWVVRSGIKYGGDYVLYKDGPPFYHSSFVVFIVSNIGIRSNSNVKYFLACHRAVEVARKELLICRVKIPENIDLNRLKECQVSDYTQKRWLPSEHRNTRH